MLSSHRLHFILGDGVAQYSLDFVAELAVSSTRNPGAHGNAA